MISADQDFYEDDEPLADLLAAIGLDRCPASLGAYGASDYVRLRCTKPLGHDGNHHGEVADPLPAQVRRAGGAQVGDGSGK